jgi:hypothetical protein
VTRRARRGAEEKLHSLIATTLANGGGHDEIVRATSRQVADHVERKRRSIATFILVAIALACLESGK